MTCHDARDLFSALADDALDAAERAALDAHLAGCAECRREWERFSATVSLLRAVEPARAPASFVDRVLAAARPASWHRRLTRALFLPWPVKLPVEAAALVLVGVAVALVFRATPELQQAARVEPPPAVTAPEPRPPEAPRPAAVPEPAAPPAPPPTATEPARTTDEPATARYKVAEVEPSRPATAAPTGTREERAGGAAARRDAAEGDVRQELALRSAPAAVAPAERKAAAPRPGTVQPLAKEGASGDARRQPLAPAAPLADVSGRLVARDPAAAERGLAALLAEVGGVTRSRLQGADGTTFELTVPRARWADFSRGLARLGAWTPEREPGEAGADVRLTLRLTSR